MNYEADQFVFFSSYSYSRGGEQHVRVEAKNDIFGSTENLTFEVTAKSDIGQIDIQLRPAKTDSGVLKITTKQNFEITVSTVYKQPVIYTFQFSDDYTSEPKRTADGDTKITYSYERETDYNVTITLNITGYSEKHFVHVIAKTCGPAALYFPDSYTKTDPQVITKDVTFRLDTSSVRKKEDCSQWELRYQWNICQENQLILLGDVLKDLPSLVIPPGLLKAANYSVSLNVTYNDSQTEEQYYFRTYLRVEKSRLFAVLSGGNSFREVDSKNSTSLELTFSASGSYDPDDRDNQKALNFTWECKFDQNSVKAVDGEVCNSISFVALHDTSDTLTYHFDKFRENVTYTFRVTVSKDTRSAHATQRVKLVPNIPSLEIR